eukprot:scaffold30284_cov33-Phaeocystis_antarctica.AAC.1
MRQPSVSTSPSRRRSSRRSSAACTPTNCTAGCATACKRAPTPTKQPRGTLRLIWSSVAACRVPPHCRGCRGRPAYAYRSLHRGLAVRLTRLAHPRRTLPATARQLQLRSLHARGHMVPDGKRRPAYRTAGRRNRLQRTVGATLA